MKKALKAYIDSKDYGRIAEDCIFWIRNWFDVNGPEAKAVIGISGGKDSSIVAALCVKALGKDRVFGVLMPRGMQPDIAYAQNLVSFLGIDSVTINIGQTADALENTIRENGIALSTQATVNLQPRLRMTTLYAVSQCLGGRVSNNSNRSERFVGYSTIYGDSAGDFSPLLNLTVTEVKEIGRAIGLPDEFIEKPPSDGLSGKTDEDNIGVSYEDLDTYILTGICDDDAVRARIESKHNANLFKTRPMPAFEL